MFWKYAASLQENTYAEKWFQENCIEITLRHGCSPVNFLHIFRTLFPKIPLNGCFWLSSDILGGALKQATFQIKSWFLKKEIEFALHSHVFENGFGYTWSSKRNYFTAVNSISLTRTKNYLQYS